MTIERAEPTPVLYTCAHCERRFVAQSSYESDKPNGYYVEVRKVDGGRYSTHTRTPAPVFFCGEPCLIAGVQEDLSALLEPTVPHVPDGRSVPST